MPKSGKYIKSFTNAVAVVHERTASHLQFVSLLGLASELWPGLFMCNNAMNSRINCLVSTNTHTHTYIQTYTHTRYTCIRPANGGKPGSADGKCGKHTTHSTNFASFKFSFPGRKPHQENAVKTWIKCANIKHVIFSALLHLTISRRETRARVAHNEFAVAIYPFLWSWILMYRDAILLADFFENYIDFCFSKFWTTHTKGKKTKESSIINVTLTQF